MKSKTVRQNGLESSSRLIRGFADPVRLRLLNLLSEDREVCVCHLHRALELAQPTVSRHLAYLRRLALVEGRKQGLWVYYRRAKPRSPLLRGLLGCVQTLSDEAVMRADRERLARLTACCDQIP